MLQVGKLEIISMISITQRADPLAYELREAFGKSQNLGCVGVQ